jgi:hypothetical protein
VSSVHTPLWAVPGAISWLYLIFTADDLNP